MENIFLTCYELTAYVLNLVAIREPLGHASCIVFMTVHGSVKFVPCVHDCRCPCVSVCHGIALSCMIVRCGHLVSIPLSLFLFVGLTTLVQVAFPPPAGLPYVRHGFPFSYDMPVVCGGLLVPCLVGWPAAVRRWLLACFGGFLLFERERERERERKRERERTTEGGIGMGEEGENARNKPHTNRTTTAQKPHTNRTQTAQQ